MNSRRPVKKKSDNFFSSGLPFFWPVRDFFGFSWWPSCIIPTLPTSTPCNWFDDLKAVEGVTAFPFITRPTPERTNENSGNYKNNLLKVRSLDK